MIGLLAAGIGVCIVGLLAVGFGIPISDTSFGNALNERYGLALSPTMFFEFPTPHGMASYLVREQGEVMRRHFSVSTRPAATMPAPATWSSP